VHTSVHDSWEILSKRVADGDRVGGWRLLRQKNEKKKGNRTIILRMSLYIKPGSPLVTVVSPSEHKLIIFFFFFFFLFFFVFSGANYVIRARYVFNESRCSSRACAQSGSSHHAIASRFSCGLLLAVGIACLISCCQRSSTRSHGGHADLGAQGRACTHAQSSRSSSAALALSDIRFIFFLSRTRTSSYRPIRVVKRMRHRMDIFLLRRVWHHYPDIESSCPHCLLGGQALDGLADERSRSSYEWRANASSIV